MRCVAVVGSGIAGLATAHGLAGSAAVTLFEAGPWFGGHAHTVDVRLNGISHGVDTGFLVFNERTYPQLIALFDALGVASAASEMSFSVQAPALGWEWCGSNPNGVFAQRPTARTSPPSGARPGYEEPALRRCARGARGRIFRATHSHRSGAPGRLSRRRCASRTPSTRSPACRRSGRSSSTWSARLEAPRFVVHDIVVDGDQCFLSWDFLFRFKRFAAGTDRVLRGASHLRLDAEGRISLHRDYWDAAEELYEILPAVGALMRWLKRRANS